MYKVAALDLEMDLRPFSRYLYHQGIDHRIIEESGTQVLWVRQEGQVAMVTAALRDWQAGLLALPTVPASNPADRPPLGQTVLIRVLIALWQAPITGLITLMTLVVAAMTRLGRDTRGMDALFYPPLPLDSLGALLGAIDGPVVFLRTLAPMLLHFGELHLVFNLLWLWYFGRQLERTQPAGWVLAVYVGTSFVANTAQYLLSGAANFGGLSGVVYGLVGYVWLVGALVPASGVQLKHSTFLLFVFMLIVMELVASSWIATAAHAGGLVGGLLLGGMVSLLSRRRR